MEASAAKTTPNQMGMGRPSDETLAEDDDERCIRSRIVPDDFGSFEKGPSIRILEDWLKHEAEPPSPNPYHSLGIFRRVERPCRCAGSRGRGTENQGGTGPSDDHQKAGNEESIRNHIFPEFSG